MDATAFVRRMLQNFDGRFTSAMRQKAATRGIAYIRYHPGLYCGKGGRASWGAAPDRRRFSQPIEAGHVSRCDPTVQYALANESANRAIYGYWKELVQEDLAVDSPYNTYRYAGLPPGPICSPGLASIQAVLDPEASDYLYFVAREGESHAFAATLEGHIENVGKVQKLSTWASSAIPWGTPFHPSSSRRPSIVWHSTCTMSSGDGAS